jgi:hypothetical protein
MMGHPRLSNLRGIRNMEFFAAIAQVHMHMSHFVLFPPCAYILDFSYCHPKW